LSLNCRVISITNDDKLIIKKIKPSLAQYTYFGLVTGLGDPTIHEYNAAGVTQRFD